MKNKRKQTSGLLPKKEGLPTKSFGTLYGNHRSGDTAFYSALRLLKIRVLGDTKNREIRTRNGKALSPALVLALKSYSDVPAAEIAIGHSLALAIAELALKDKNDSPTIVFRDRLTFESVGDTLFGRVRVFLLRNADVDSTLLYGIS